MADGSADRGHARLRHPLRARERIAQRGAHRLDLNQGLAFGLANLAWATGQTVASAGSGALAQATSDIVPYSLLAATFLATLLVLQRSRHLVSG